MQGRSDNQVKNRFYTNLIKRLNDPIFSFEESQEQEINDKKQNVDEKENLELNFETRDSSSDHLIGIKQSIQDVHKRFIDEDSYPSYKVDQTQDQTDDI